MRRILEDPDVERLLSVASEIEVGMQSWLGKLDLTNDELTAICSTALITSYPLRRVHADQLDLPCITIPFDRLIIGCAQSTILRLFSRDKQFRKYHGLRIVC